MGINYDDGLGLDLMEGARVLVFASPASALAAYAGLSSPTIASVALITAPVAIGASAAAVYLEKKIDYEYEGNANFLAPFFAAAVAYAGAVVADPLLSAPSPKTEPARIAQMASPCELPKKPCAFQVVTP